MTALVVAAAGLFAIPAFSGEINSSAGSAGADRKAAADGLSLQLRGGNWDDAMEVLDVDQRALGAAPQLSQRDSDAGESGDGVPMDTNEIARQSNNPLGGDFILWLNFITMDKQDGDITDENRYAYNHLLQPVIPIRMPQIGKNWVFVNRPAVSLFYDKEVPKGPSQSDPGVNEFEHQGGFGDVEYLALLGTSTPTNSGWLAESFGIGDAVVAAGFTTRWPTGKTDLSENVYAAGPAATAAYLGKDWTLAFLYQHWWHYERQSGADDFNNSRLQLFYIKSLPDGWQIGGTPKITVDWSESSDDRWTVPIGLAAFKTVTIGDLPVRFGLEFRPTIIRPDSFGTDWQIEFSVIPVTRNFIAEWLK